MTADVVALPLAELRRRTSEKWREYPEGVLPLFVSIGRIAEAEA